ncbi:MULTISPECIES: hypothetical protein [Streptomyces]|uniref:Uncharacterized protein n=1 Tax=Streptomyces galilaeus TaxID=33899 RepID=A0ABW9IYK0_STRGJ
MYGSNSGWVSQAPQVAAVVEAGGLDRLDAEVGEAGVDQCGVALGTLQDLGDDADLLLLVGDFGGGEPVQDDGLVGGGCGHRLFSSGALGWFGARFRPRKGRRTTDPSVQRIATLRGPASGRRPGHWSAASRR